jgi:hypothetical protein
MLMPQPELKDNDVFHVIGFTNQDVLSGAHLQLMQRLRVPTHPPGTEPVEVYFFDRLLMPDPAAFKPYGNYLSVYFYSDTALELSKHYGIKLPPVIAKITRTELPWGLGTSIRIPFPD